MRGCRFCFGGAVISENLMWKTGREEKRTKLGERELFSKSLFKAAAFRFVVRFTCLFVFSC